METPLSIFFLLYALGQALFEIGSFILILALLKKWGPKWIQFIFIALSFVLCLVHFTDFTLIRLMDAPISYLFKFLFCSGAFKVLQALNLNMSMILITSFALLAIPLLGPLCYWLANRISRKTPIRISISQIAIGLTSIVIALFTLDLLAKPFLDRPQYATLKKTLPFKGTFLHPAPQCISLPTPLTPARIESEVHQKLPHLTAAQLPNIYVFVIETLRRDFINEQTAPHMSQFANENLSFPHSFANSNGTQGSWFAIFHSDYPYHWTKMRDTWTEGSIPLYLLKQMGYKIRAYSSADLCYFDMDRLIFGKQRQLADSIEEFSLRHHLQPCERDALAMTSFEKDLKLEGGKSGTVYLFFYDSTHSEYSFPKDFPLRFEPIASQIDYLTLSEEKIEPIKNRYRNAIAYVDDLIGKFFSTLKKEGLYEEAVIAITGDHGEEFFEEGALFHGTHLNSYQTQVPIFCKLPIQIGPAQTEEATHIDIFPSILHALTGVDSYDDLFDGQSLFFPHRGSCRIAVLQNGPATPNEFVIAEKGSQFRIRFLNQDIYQQTKVELVDFQISEKLSEAEIHKHLLEKMKKVARPIQGRAESEIENFSS